MPWSAIGPGWFLVAVDSKTTRLLLVDPSGHHYPVYTARRSGLAVAGWSGDGQRVLLAQNGAAWPARTTVVDLRTGREWQPALPRQAAVIGFTAPRGVGLLTATMTSRETDSESRYRLERRDLNGDSTAVLARDVTEFNAVYTQSGTAVVLPFGKGLALVANATGARLRTLAGSTGCVAARMWDRTHVLAHCPHSLSLLSLDGDSAIALLRPDSQKGPDYDDVDAWQLPSGIYTDAMGACGYEFVGHLGSDGHVHEFPIPHTTGNTVPLTAWQGRLAVAAVQGCEGSVVPSLLWFDPATQAEQVLWAPHRGDTDVRFVAYPQS